LERFGLNGKAKALGSNRINESDNNEEDAEDGLELTAGEAKEFRGVAVRLNFLSQDSPDLQHPAKTIARDMAAPTWGSWKRMNKHT
jgi:hypothetical protein